MKHTESPQILAALLDEVRRVDRIGQTPSDQLSDMNREFWVSHPLAYLGDYPRPIERVVEWLEALLGEDCGSRTVDAMMRSATSSIVDLTRERDEVKTAILDAFSTAYPTWYRGMYGCPDDMFSRQDVMRIIRAAQSPATDTQHPDGRPCCAECADGERY